MARRAGDRRLLAFVVVAAVVLAPLPSRGQTLELSLEALGKLERSSTIEVKVSVGNAEWLHRSASDCQLEFDIGVLEVFWRTDPTRWVAKIPNACVHAPSGEPGQSYAGLRNAWRVWGENVRGDEAKVTGVPRLVPDPAHWHRIELNPVTRIEVLEGLRAARPVMTTTPWLHDLPSDLQVLDARSLERTLQSVNVRVGRRARNVTVTVDKAPAVVTSFLRATVRLNPSRRVELPDGGRRTPGAVVVDGRAHDVMFLTAAGSDANRALLDVTGPVSAVGLLSLDPAALLSAAGAGGGAVSRPIQVIVLRFESAAPVQQTAAPGPRPIAIQLETKGKGFSVGTPIATTIKLVNAENQLASGDRDIVVTLSANGKAVKEVTFRKGEPPIREESIVVNAAGLATITATSPNLRGAETKIVLTKPGSGHWDPSPAIRLLRYNHSDRSPNVMTVANHDRPPGLISLELNEPEARVGGGNFATILGWVTPRATKDLHVTLLRIGGTATFAVPGAQPGDKRLLRGKDSADLVIPAGEVTGTLYLHADQPGVITLKVVDVPSTGVNVSELRVAFSAAEKLCLEVPDARERAAPPSPRTERLCPDLGSDLNVFENASVEARLVDALGNSAKTFVERSITFSVNGPGQLEPRAASIRADAHDHSHTRIVLRPTGAGKLRVRASMLPFEATKDVYAGYWSGALFLFLALGGLAGMLNYVSGGSSGGNALHLPTSLLLLLYFVIGSLAVLVALAGLVPNIPSIALAGVSPLLFRVGVSVLAGWGSVALLNFGVKGWLRTREG